jgi:hypothetical protein
MKKNTFETIEFNYDKSSLGMRLFLSLSMQQALSGIQLFGNNDNLSQEIDGILVELILSASNVLFENPIEA